ncbi:ArgE/DapE family deacylase [Natronococcus occultus]|uniref:Acetylornithine deacetylase or succinyl-diaminopimelate desuccinylase n=1 Tax=Natronococcus occultus SP4 TaxID=694430 RepID=L0K4T5_9EURY|nr:ArgE/DapE family deacylase [Natronococcus occultus]AGB40031.1 acetylornithine deacetylase or succinyl-diaminopimelate desuccinylase [Natronococcus occultus SP4]
MEVRREQFRELAETLVSYSSYPGEERAVQTWLRDRLSDLGFETYTWEPDAELIESHPSFPDAETLELEGRPSVAGVLELGDPENGPTVVLNGHADVVPVTESDWSGDPFEPRWENGRLYGRGAVDMKSGLAACVFAALAVEEARHDVDGRIVVESVVGEEEGGIGAATAAASNPYPFDRDAVLIAEPSELDLVVAAEGSLMKRLQIYGESAHAARTWEGESVLPHFERIRQAFIDLERERAERVTHPLFEQFENPWPVNFGTVDAGAWASSVPASLTAEIRIGVAPHETIAEVEAEYQQRLDEVVAESGWLSAHPPDFERFSVQFEGSEVNRKESIVQSLAQVLRDNGIEPAYEGFTGGTDARHYLEADIPTIVCGPGSPDVAHKPDEFIEWEEAIEGAEIIADTVETYLRTQ